MVWTPSPGMAKVIRSTAGLALASRIACLSEPGPLSAVVVTTKLRLENWSTIVAPATEPSVVKSTVSTPSMSASASGVTVSVADAWPAGMRMSKMPPFGLPRSAGLVML